MPYEIEKVDEAIELLETENEVLLNSLNELPIEIHPSLGVKGDGTRQDARLKLSVIWTKFRDEICGSQRVKEAATNQTTERRALIVCAIADVLGFSGAMTASALIVKESLHTSCDEQWGLEENYLE